MTNLSDSQNVSVCLNSFKIKTLTESDRTVKVYRCNFKQSPKESEINSKLNKIAYKVWTPAVKYKSNLITYESIKENKLENKEYNLSYESEHILDPSIAIDCLALERLQRNSLRYQLKKHNDQYEIDSSADGGFIWWNKEKVEIQSQKFGWEVHKGVNIDVRLNSQGNLYLEIDSHYRLYTSWTLTDWINRYPEVSLSSFLYIRNTYDNNTWKNPRRDPRRPEEIVFENTDQNLADFHLNHKKRPASIEEIQSSYVIQVQGTTRENRKQTISHLSSRVRPCVSLDLLAILKDRGDQEVSKVFTEIKPIIQDRLAHATTVAQHIAYKIYKLSEEDSRKIKPFSLTGDVIKFQNNFLLAYKNTEIDKVYKSLSKGFFRTGETKLGYLNLIDNRGCSKFILQQIDNIAKIHNQSIDVNSIRYKRDIPESPIQRSKFWKSWRNEGIQTVLVVCDWLQDKEKLDFTKDALEHGIALQFMLPIKESVRQKKLSDGKFKEEVNLLNSGDRYRIQNILLGLFAKAAWQAVGLNQVSNHSLADLVIGFDAGRNDTLSYGTSSFAVLADGQTLGWELPEAQQAESMNSDHVKLSVRKMIGQFQDVTNGKLPTRILLMRDGLIQANEFDSLLKELEQENILYDLISVRKSGAGRIAQLIQTHEDQEKYIDASKGTVVFSGNNKFRIITSEAKAGGSARPLFIVRESGNTPIKNIAEQIYALTQLHPTSAAFPSRLPMPLHYSDKLAKKVQSLGSVGVLQNISRQKLFFV